MDTNPNIRRQFIMDLLTPVLEENGASNERKAEINGMVWSGRWDSLYMISSKDLIMRMIDHDLLQDEHEEWLNSPNMDWEREETGFSETIRY